MCVTGICLAALLLGAFQFARWRARPIVAEKRVTSTAHLLCRGIQDYRQRTGQLPTSLDQITNSPEVDAGWLRKVTNILSVSYQPHSTDGGIPRLIVTDGRTCVTVAGPGFRYDRQSIWSVINLARTRRSK